eukprot:8575275-Karenia_brevis.AAC.1
MVAIVQQLPTRRKPQGSTLVVVKPSALQILEAKGHQVTQRGQRHHCMMCGQEWGKEKQMEGMTCPGPK